jgi:hypothetical protein
MFNCILKVHCAELRCRLELKSIGVPVPPVLYLQAVRYPAAVRGTPVPTWVLQVAVQPYLLHRRYPSLL